MQAEQLGEGSQELSEHLTDQNVHTELTALTLPEGRQQFLAEIDSQLDDYQMRRIARVVDQLKEYEAQIWGSNPSEGYDSAMAARRDRLYERTTATYGHEAIQQYNDLTAEKEALEEGRRVEVIGESANQLLGHIVEEATNSHVDDRAHLFVDDQRMVSVANGLSPDKKMTLRMERTDAPVKVPLGMFVSAASFESWNG